MGDVAILPQEQESQPAQGNLTLTDPGIIAIGQRAEKLVAALKIIRAAVLKLTNEKDWENLGGKPYLNEGGAKKVGAAFGVSWQLDAPTREDYEDGHYDFMVQGQFEFRGTRIDEVGTRSSKDDFFAKSRGKEIPPSEIDRNEVKKAAITNCIARGVKSVLALKNFTWDELRASGIDQSKVSQVEYGKGDNDPNASPKLPNYGRCKGMQMDDPAVPIEELRYYLSGAEKSIADPEKAKYKTNNERMRDALKAEIAKREGASGAAHTPETEPAAESANTAAAGAPSTFIWRFGADHKGKPITEIPDKYLEWAKSNMKNPEHADAARLELDRRQAQASFVEEAQ